MNKLYLFIGPPSHPSMDESAVRQFIEEPGEKIICGGTTSSIFERILRKKATVNLQSYSDGVPPYGFLGSILVTECTVTLEKLTAGVQAGRLPKNAAGEFIKRITAVPGIKIYLGRAKNKVNGENKELVIKNFIEYLKSRGKRVEILEF